VTISVARSSFSALIARAASSLRGNSIGSTSPVCNA